MDENMNAGQDTQAVNMGNEADAQGTDPDKGKGQKMFTQDEVNGFVQSRISRMKGQIEKETKAEYDQKFAELEAREMRLLIKEKLDDRGMSRELADIITCTDENDLNSKLDTLQKIYGGTAAKKNEKPTGFTIGAPGGPHMSSQVDPVRKAMGLYE